MSDRDDNDYGGEDFDDNGEIEDEVEILTDQEDLIEDANQGLGITEKKKKIKVPDSERITSRFMTKYEKARILGTRAL